jgi:hypothetical protein
MFLPANVSVRSKRGAVVPDSQAGYLPGTFPDPELSTKEYMMSHHALDYPENCLWISNSDGSGGFIDYDRLGELAYCNASPRDETEKALVADPVWLRIYLTHVIGNYTVTIKAGGPLPEWNPAGLGNLEEYLWVSSPDHSSGYGVAS